MKVTNNLNIKMNRDRLWNDRYREDPKDWNNLYHPIGCYPGKQSLRCDARQKKDDKKVTPIVKEQAKTPSF